MRKSTTDTPAATFRRVLDRMKFAIATATAAQVATNQRKHTTPGDVPNALITTTTTNQVNPAAPKPAATAMSTVTIQVLLGVRSRRNSSWTVAKPITT